MARYGQRPENALKRANEFIEVGKPARALDTLYEVFKNKKWAYNWSESVLEPIMFKYLELCVELKKSHIAKEGLFQYRNMFQSVNVGSLENVIRGYLRSAEERTESAREQSQQAVIDIDDLDMLTTPESILLSAVSGEDAQDRSDRTILTPWVKFLWESYCQCLELLRTNAHVETLYHDIAKMAFNFCLKYNRKTEFRKLCDKLRKHLEDIGKLPPQTVNVSLSKPETQQYNLETRLVQLDSAIQMELWQEAYKATEDIHNLMTMSKKSSVPKTMANYYQKLAMVFWKAGYYLFHAAALFKLFTLNKEMKKNITPEEVQRMANMVVLATLSVPLPSAHPEFDRFIETDKSPLEKAQKLSVLLGLQQPPTRQSLLKDIVRLNILSLASPTYQNLYSWLEVEFNPLELTTRVASLLSNLEDEQYAQPLRDVTLVKLMLQLCQVYQTIEFARLMELTSEFATPFHMERLLVECVRNNDMQIRIDHGAGCIHFGTDLSESQREDKQDGPLLQPMPSEQIRNQLINMSTVLTKSLQIINPHLDAKERNTTHATLIRHYHTTKQAEHLRILARHKIIEDRKEHLEKMNTQREEEEHRRLEEAQRAQMMAEQERLAHERLERERKRVENEIAMMKERNLKEKVQQISQTTHGQKILRKLDDTELKNLDADQITARELEELQKERRELQQKLKSQEKKMDYFERAKRLEEIPLIEKAYDKKKVLDREQWEKREAKRIAQLIEERNLAVAHRERLKRLKEDKEYFMNKLLKERQSSYESKLEAFEKRLTEERKKRLAKRKQERKRDRRQAWLEAKEAEERKREEEEEKKRRDEEAKRRLEREESARKLSEAKPEPYRPKIPATTGAAAPARYEPPRSRDGPSVRFEDEKPATPAAAPAPTPGKYVPRAAQQAAATQPDEPAPAPASDKYTPPVRQQPGPAPDAAAAAAPAGDKYTPPSQRGAATDGKYVPPMRTSAPPPAETSTGKYVPPTRAGPGATGPPPERYGGRQSDREYERRGDRDVGRGGDRDIGRGGDRDRMGGGRDTGRDRDGGRDFGRGGDRDRDMGRGGDRDRDMGRGGDRDREMVRGGERDIVRGGDRDRDAGGKTDGGNWRSGGGGGGGSGGAGTGGGGAGGADNWRRK
uniref:Eukaryotic translation initiation factor 3 subunit A n=1 Tax=Cacopsylla melanoneura TaxID=428564 RepID=A0A8D9BB26_9HEMI